MNRAYSVLDIKAVDDDARTITGIASTPTPDRMEDIVDPAGAKFGLPLPLLWQHDSRDPIGQVTEAKVTKRGIEIAAHIAKGVSADIDVAWAKIKAGLVRGLSIGFRSLETEPIKGSHGVRFKSWEWLELSAVTIPANSEANILTIKQFDTGLSAAPGHTKSAVAVSPGASGKPQPEKPKEKPMAKTIAEQISAFEATRAAKLARMDTIMDEAGTKGETLDAEQESEHDGLDAEVKSIDAHLKRLRDREAYQAMTAKAVTAVETLKAASESRGGSIVVRPQEKLAPGIRYARYAKVKTVSRLENERPLDVARQMYGDDSEIVALFSKAGEVQAGSTVTGNWLANLVGEETSMVADFHEYLRPATILGKFGSGSVPSLSGIDFRVPIITQLTGGAAYWVGEGKPKPLTSFTYARTTLEPLKIANICVLTEESIRYSSPKADTKVAESLRNAIAAGLDVAFIDPANAGTANVKPASITNGAATVASSGDDADAIRMDIRSLFQEFLDANNPPQTGVWIMSGSTALALQLTLNALGQPEFPGITMTGGTFEGMPVITSQHVGDIVVLANASDIYEADEGAVSVDMSREASLEMRDATLVQDAGLGTGTSLVSMFQTNSVAIRAERTINWLRARPSAVAYLTGVSWGGALPA